MAQNARLELALQVLDEWCRADAGRPVAGDPADGGGEAVGGPVHVLRDGRGWILDGRCDLGPGFCLTSRRTPAILRPTRRRWLPRHDRHLRRRLTRGARRRLTIRRDHESPVEEA